MLRTAILLQCFITYAGEVGLELGRGAVPLLEIPCICSSPSNTPRGLKRDGEHHPSSAAVTPTGYGSRLLAMSVPHTAARGRLGNLKQLSSLLGTLLGLPPHSRSKLSSPVKAVITVGLKILQDRPRLFSLALPLVCTPFFPRFQSQGLLVV